MDVSQPHSDTEPRRIVVSGRGEVSSTRLTKEKKSSGTGSAVIGGIGEILVTLSVITALFIVWELWWTNIPAHHAVAQAVEQFEKHAVSSPVHAGPHNSPATAPVIAGVAADVTMGTMRIPRFSPSFNVPIVQAATNDASESSPDRYNILNHGELEHYKDTAMPGQIGNFSVAGHRMTYGHPFNQIAALQNGDEIIIETTQYWFVYTVTGHEIVQPDDAAAIAPVPDQLGATPTLRSITLTACHPEYSAALRYVVHGTLTYWMNKGQGVPDAFLNKQAVL